MKSMKNQLLRNGIEIKNNKKINGFYIKY